MWGTMRRLLSIIAKSIMDVGYLTIVLFIVLYIFAVIGELLSVHRPILTFLLTLQYCSS